MVSKSFDPLQAKKELLMMKAELERMELADNVSTLKKRFAWFDVFKPLGMWLGARNCEIFGQKFFKNPLLGMLVSTLLLRFRRPIARLTFKAGLTTLVVGAGVRWIQARANRLRQIRGL